MRPNFAPILGLVGLHAWFVCDTKPAFIGDVFGHVIFRRILSNKINDLNAT
jgi:hypothetical protein